METREVPKTDEETPMQSTLGIPLTQERFDLIKKMLYQGELIKDIASQLHMGTATIGRIRNTKTLAEYFKLSRESYLKYNSQYKKSNNKTGNNLTAEDFTTIKVLLSAGTSEKDITAATGRAHSTIFKIKKVQDYEEYLALSRKEQAKYSLALVEKTPPVAIPPTPPVVVSFTQEIETLIEKEVQRRVLVKLNAIRNMI